MLGVPHSSIRIETAPLSLSPGKQDASHPAYKAISAAAARLNELRENWLNPPEWLKPIEDAVDRFEDFSGVPAEALPLIRRSAIMAKAAQDKRLKRRTLTILYNERPTWLKECHKALDEAVLAAYAATDPEGDWQTLINESAPEVWYDTGAGAPLPENHALADKRKETDQRILAALLRLNHTRAAP